MAVTLLQPAKKHHLKAIDGLRGYLALWVAVGHALLTSGYLALKAPLSLLEQGGAAVQIFIIISGFVITQLLMKGRETYPEYITRRFFRLYPAYVLCCIFGYFTLPVFSQLSHHVPWIAEPRWQSYLQSADEISSQTTQNTLAQALVHATMLHGAVPSQWLPRAAVTFLPAAWSISLEWQFYLLAPLILLATRSARGVLLLTITAIVMFGLYKKGFLGNYHNDSYIYVTSSIAVSSGYFAVGIISRLFYERLSEMKVNPLAFSLVVVYLAIFHIKDALPLVLWICFFGYVLWNERAPVTGAVFRALTSSKVPLFIGTISYSIYLLHRPLQFLGFEWAASVSGAGSPVYLAAQLLAIVVTIPVAYLMYILVETPGQNLGRFLATKIRALTDRGLTAEPATSR